MEDELDSEARIHELEARIEELQALRASDRAEVEALRQSETQAHAELESTRTSSEHLKQQNRDLLQSSKDVKQAKDKAEAEKRELLDALARSDGDKQALEGVQTDPLCDLLSLSSQPRASGRPADVNIQFSSLAEATGSCTLGGYGERAQLQAQIASPGRRAVHRQEGPGLEPCRA